ncbi:MAG: ABC transporter ATP-binding protein [Christensenellales bacterium]
MKLKNISKSFGDNKIFSNFDIEFSEGKITAVLGPSGCGKTTLLNIISGLTDFSGKREINPIKKNETEVVKSISDCDKSERISYMFQSLRLIPNLTVYGNLEYVLKDIRNKNERRETIFDILKKVELFDKKDAYPSELSGGMAQRAALARAFVYAAPLLLMDEPFKGLDVSLKKRVIDVFVKLYSDDGRTVVFVTHDIDEALLLADRIIVLKKGGEIIFDGVIDKPRADRSIGDFSDLKNKLYDIL